MPAISAPTRVQRLDLKLSSLMSPSIALSRFSISRFTSICLSAHSQSRVASDTDNSPLSGLRGFIVIGLHELPLYPCGPCQPIHHDERMPLDIPTSKEQVHGC